MGLQKLQLFRIAKFSVNFIPFHYFPTKSWER